MARCRFALEKSIITILLDFSMMNLSKSYLKVIGTKVKFIIGKSFKIALIVSSTKERHLATFMKRFSYLSRACKKW